MSAFLRMPLGQVIVKIHRPVELSAAAAGALVTAVEIEILGIIL